MLKVDTAESSTCIDSDSEAVIFSNSFALLIGGFLIQCDRDCKVLSELAIKGCCIFSFMGDNFK